ncbi:hypothetical protein HNP84_000434 [Thermocatellispora tengchongensis]|uniref:Uncharacterized protein n=1 Tax=Thermocatellispora tengchongensis TaxID=1073253 RepID=A0A840NX18_9ACTN|nr:hypothetical protein [Thermocatellispora tengchongensis]MBB5130746.1 hypothetical protein [Thermocatellispora tengchongensis]
MRSRIILACLVATASCVVLTAPPASATTLTMAGHSTDRASYAEGIHTIYEATPQGLCFGRYTATISGQVSDRHGGDAIGAAVRVTYATCDAEGDDIRQQEIIGRQEPYDPEEKGLDRSTFIWVEPAVRDIRFSVCNWEPGTGKLTDCAPLTPRRSGRGA